MLVDLHLIHVNSLYGEITKRSMQRLVYLGKCKRTLLPVYWFVNTSARKVIDDVPILVVPTHSMLFVGLGAENVHQYQRLCASVREVAPGEPHSGGGNIHRHRPTSGERCERVRKVGCSVDHN